MIIRSFSLVLILLFLAFGAGCIQNTQSSPHETPGTADTLDMQTPVETENQTHPSQVLQNETESVTVPTMIVPTTYPTAEQVVKSNITPKPSQKPDKNTDYRDRMTLVLDDMQAAKEGIILTYRAGDIERVKQKSKEFSDLLRKNAVIPDMPSKLDYARMNYIEYTDQASQFAQSFSNGAARWIAADKSSANSLFDAGIMASDRADIADKRIRKFFRDHIQQTQVNQS